MKSATVLATAMLMSVANFASLEAQEEDAVLAVVQQLFDAIEQRDSALLASVSLPSMRTIRVRDTGAVDTRVGSLEEFKEGLAGGGPSLREEIFDPEVRISGPMATVWGFYQFHVGGEFSHCGLDSFQLVREEDGWKFAQLIYTVVPDPDRCADMFGGSDG